MDGSSSDGNGDFPEWVNPPAECRPAVLWSWNGDMSPPRITEMLEGFAHRNIGGVFIHPRPGLITEYLSEKWFELWASALQECKRLGLACHIYDENSFPSGFAGGHVAAALPLAANSRLTGHWASDPERGRKSNGRHMAFLTRDPATGFTLGHSKQPAGNASSPLMALEMEAFPASLWQGGFPMTDVCRAEVTRQFIESTHAGYAARFADEFGKAVRYVFTDEPETGTSDKGFHLSQSFLKEFLAEHGYPLESRLAGLCGSCTESPSVRHDYFVTLNRLFTRNFAAQCHDWCGAHSLAFTGHFLENEWPLPKGCPSTMAAQRWMQAPGVDLLGFQFAAGADNSFWLLTIKEATSVAAQCGRTEVLCESCGGGGYGYGPAEMKPLEDFLLALGVNRFAPHLAHESLAGVRKYDWPQTISDHSPWWDAYGAHALHVARTNHMLGMGSASNRILVLHPTTTGWMHYRPACFHWPDESPHTALENLRKEHAAFLASLYSAQVDFDLGDESVMAEMASAGAGTLAVGACSYETVVVPAGMENMLGSTVRVLTEFLKSGGTVLCAGDPPGFINGRPAELPCTNHPRWVNAGDHLIPLLRERHPPKLSSPDGSPLPAGLMWRYAPLHESGAIVFFSNPTAAEISSEVAVKGSAITAFDTQSGLRTRLVTRRDSSRVIHPITLAPGGHALWLVEAGQAKAIGAKISAEAWSDLPVRSCGCAPSEPNVVALEYCDYRGPGIEAPDISTLHADNANWRAQGFDQNLWRVSIQYRRTFLDAQMPDFSEFAVRFPFEVAESVVATDHDLHAAVERPWLYEISCNGVPVSQVTSSPWFDEEMRLLRLGGAVVGGHNILELRARRFHVLAEIMPVFLRGTFRAVPAARGFRLDAPTPWKGGGDWGAEGYPFYPWHVRYRFAFSLPAAGRVRTKLPGFSGSAAGVSVNGGAPLWAISAGQTILHPDPLPAGAHSLDILLSGNLKNLLGPHFSNGLPGAWSWEDCPPSQPPGSAYRFQRTGLSGIPILETSPD